MNSQLILAQYNITDIYQSYKQNFFDFIFYEGTKYFLSGEYDNAEQCYMKCIELNPDISVNYYWLSLIYSYKMMNYKSLEYAKKSVNFDSSDNKWYKLRLSDAYSAVFEFDSSAMILKEMITKNAEKEDFYIYVVDKFLKFKLYKDALDILEKYEDTFGYKDFVAISRIGLYIKLSDDKNANREIQRFLNFKEEDSEKALKSVVKFYYEIGKQDLAFKLLKKRIKRDNRLEAMWINMFFSEYYIENHNSRLAKKYLIKYLSDENVNMEDGVDFLYFVFLNNPRYNNKSETADYIDCLLDEFPDNTYINLLQVYYFKAIGEEKKMFEVLKKTIDRDKTNFFICCELIEYYLKNEMISEAYDLSLECIKCFPEDFFPNYALSVALIKMKKYEEALPYLKKALDGTFDTNERIICYNFLEDCYCSLGDIEKVFSIYDKILELQPDNDVVLNKYAYRLSMKEKRLDAAEYMSFRAVNLVPSKNFYFITYAWILFQRKKYGQALEAIRRAFEIEEVQSSVVLDHYGDILYMNGYENEAVEKWKLALKNANDSLKEKLKYKIKHGISGLK